MDFGSTYTKLTAVDLEEPRLLGTASAHTTVRTDLQEGLDRAMADLRARIGPVEFEARYACSSAAGGLRMVTCGLVPELTVEAARQASLGAGAKVVGVFSFQLTQEDLEQIRTLKPDIFLLAGGTDGGNTACILHNARMLASMQPDFPIIIAGNRTAAASCKALLEGCQVHVCPNVMPAFGKLNIGPTQQTIRQIFLDRIVQAKGLSHVTELISGILMPTPAAVLQAVTLLAQGCPGEPGIGELIAVDVGGATTDVYSVADGMPQGANTVYKGLPEPFAKRTVEGDIGMRYSARGIADAAGIPRLSALSGLPAEAVEALLDRITASPELIPQQDPALKQLDQALASMAVWEAVGRHCGTMEETYTLLGKTYVQSGKDLTGVRQLVVTGGSLIHTENTPAIAAYALYNPAQPGSLRPKAARVLVDRSYILSAMGLLAGQNPRAALQIMKKELESHGNS